MKKIIILVLIVISCSTYAQVNRFIYEYTFLTDSTDISSKASEVMFLDISPNGNRFYRGAELHENSTDGTNEVSGNISKVNWNYSSKSGKGYLVVPIFVNYYKIQANEKPNWKIENETKVWNQLKIQKATAKFLGRKWTAWFQKDSPVSAGPYRFTGLPGLVVMVEDENTNHQFVLMESKKLLKLPTYDFLNEEVAIPATPIQFKQKWREYMENPIAVENQMMEGMGVVFNNSPGHAVKFNREKNERKKALLKKINNPLEKQLFY